MLAHMQAVGTAKKGPIPIGGVITSISCALCLEVELATLDPLPGPSLNIHAFRHMRLIKNMRDVRYLLMISNIEVPSVILPCPNRTNVKNRANCINNLNVGIEAGPVPMDILENVIAYGAIDDEYDHKERGSPVQDPSPHHSPIFMFHFQTPHLFSLTLLNVLLSEPHTLHLMICFARYRLEIPLMLNGTALSQPYIARKQRWCNICIGCKHKK